MICCVCWFVLLDLVVLVLVWCDDSQCSSTPHHTTTHHISTLSQVPAVPASQRRTLSQSQGYPAPAASLHSAVLPSRRSPALPLSHRAALVTLSHSRDMLHCYNSLLLWPTTSEQTSSVKTLQGGSHSPNNTYLHRINGMTRISFCLLIFKSPLPLKSP